MKRILLALGLTISAAAILALLAIYFFPHVVWIQYARYQFPRDQYALSYEKPVNRAMIRRDPKIDLADHQTFNLGSLSFNTPWKNAISSESTTRGVLVSLPASRTILLPKPGGFSVSDEVKNMVKEVVGQFELD